MRRLASAWFWLPALTTMLLTTPVAGAEAFYQPAVLIITPPEILPGGEAEAYDSLIFELPDDDGKIEFRTYQNPIIVSIPGESKAPGEAVLIDSDTGRIIPRSWLAYGEVRAKVYTTGHYEVKYITAGDFEDVTGHWSHAAVHYLAVRDVVSGVGENQFVPEGAVTRDEFVTMLMRVANIDPDILELTEPFADVPADRFSYTALLQAKTLGIAAGDGDDCFFPEDILTRQEMFVLLYNAMKTLDLLPPLMTQQWMEFADWEEVDAYASSPIQDLAKLGLATGWAGNIHPQAAVSRAEAVQALYSLLRYDSWR